MVLEALSKRKTISELTEKHGLHPNQISRRKQEFISPAKIVFEKASVKKQEILEKQEKLYKIIGEQKVEIDFLKKVLS